MSTLHSFAAVASFPQQRRGQARLEEDLGSTVRRRKRPERCMEPLAAGDMPSKRVTRALINPAFLAPNVAPAALPFRVGYRLAGRLFGELHLPAHTAHDGFTPLQRRSRPGGPLRQLHLLTFRASEEKFPVGNPEPRSLRLELNVEPCVLAAPLSLLIPLLRGIAGPVSNHDQYLITLRKDAGPRARRPPGMNLQQGPTMVVQVLSHIDHKRRKRGEGVSCVLRPGC